MSDMRYDPKIKNLHNRFGAVGVYAYIVALEVIAGEMNESDKHSVTLDWAIWKAELGFYHDSVMRKWLQSSTDLDLISYQSSTNLSSISGESLTILCPKLLKIRARKFTIESKTRHTEEEVEADTDKEEKNVKKRKAQPKVSPDTFFSSLDGKLENWKLKYPRIDVSAEVVKMRAWLEANPERKKRNYDRFVVNWLNRTKPREKTWQEKFDETMAAKEKQNDENGI